MAPPSQKKRKIEEGMQGKISRPKKRMRKQRDYHSSDDESDDKQDFAPVSLGDSEEDEVSTVVPKGPKKKMPEPESESEGSEQEQQSEDDEDEDSDEKEVDEDGHLDSMANKRPTSKRNDPEAFSTSITKILSTKLSQSVRKDPVLSRSREAHEKGSILANERLEKKVKAKQRAEKKKSMDKGRVTDVLGLESGTAGEVAEEEKRLRKIAQRGVVKLFNAVRAAQVRAEQVAKDEKKKGTVGMANREKKEKELSKDAFLSMINGTAKSNP